MKKIYLLVLVSALAGCRSAPPPPTPLEQLNAQQMHGHAVYQEHCRICHNDRNNTPLVGPALIGVFKKQYLPSGAAATDERVSATILHGRNMMPAQANVIDQQDLNDLLAYLHTL
ncbi:c-type cytochrome [Edaphobacter albus]|uniref:c-type cytochrome n=1 Tax=Edaphobacter sp. 4G125 TaxID=2763071 RepID=UPI00164678D6|nr:cytochrome c [Edaphobacter sp. 4G125]QNI36740.1 cytochrome c [Edaphobacter sp. 4G125]